MKLNLKIIIILFFAICLLYSCQEDASKTDSAKTENKTCQPKGKILDGNQKLVKDHHSLICIIADETTHDKKFGESHRVLEVYDIRTCKVINREVLPINRSPDFPYYIADIIFNKNSHLVAIKGFENLYCYDTKGQRLLKSLVPEFVNERMGQDAQSGQVKHLEVWENYLIGYALDMGGFVFDLSDVENPKALKPAVEHDLSDGNKEAYSSLFFLKSENEDTYQVIAPFYDNANMKFYVNPLFENPKFISPVVSKENSDNRFVVIRTEENPSRTMVVDMNKQVQLNVPKDIATQNAQAILDWLNENKK